MDKLAEIMQLAFQKADDPNEPRRLIWEAIGLLCEGALCDGTLYQSWDRRFYTLQKAEEVAKEVIEKLG